MKRIRPVESVPFVFRAQLTRISAEHAVSGFHLRKGCPANWNLKYIIQNLEHSGNGPGVDVVIIAIEIAERFLKAKWLFLQYYPFVPERR